MLFSAILFAIFCFSDFFPLLWKLAVVELSNFHAQEVLFFAPEIITLLYIKHFNLSVALDLCKLVSTVVFELVLGF